jgi:hypothetical protein
MNADVFWRIPEYVATQLAAALDIPMLNYRPTDWKIVLDNLPSGWVDWEPGLDREQARDQSADVTLKLVIAIVVDECTEESNRSLRQLAGRAAQWVKDKKRLTEEEVGQAVKYVTLVDIDWPEIDERTGIELHGRVAEAVGLLVRLQLYE